MQTICAEHIHYSLVLQVLQVNAGTSKKKCTTKKAYPAKCNVWTALDLHCVDRLGSLFCEPAWISIV